MTAPILAKLRAEADSLLNYASTERERAYARLALVRAYLDGMRVAQEIASSASWEGPHDGDGLHAGVVAKRIRTAAAALAKAAGVEE